MLERLQRIRVDREADASTSCSCLDTGAIFIGGSPFRCDSPNATLRVTTTMTTRPSEKGRAVV
jgi:hypothetical protein